MSRFRPVIMSVRVIDARPSFGRNCFACTAASSWSWCPRSAGTLAVVAIVWRSKTSSSSRAGHYVQWKMTHSSHQTNGASLEDCHTNFFALVSSSNPLHTVLRGGPLAYTSIRSEFVLLPTTLSVPKVRNPPGSSHKALLCLHVADDSFDTFVHCTYADPTDNFAYWLYVCYGPDIISFHQPVVCWRVYSMMDWLMSCLCKVQAYNVFVMIFVQLLVLCM